jgi:hypothetical protein
MRILFVLLMVALVSGCAGRRYASFSDPYDVVKVDQLTGNNVSGQVFQRTILCLNARRETRAFHGATNVEVTLVTNISLVPLTNLTVTVITNQSRTLATNVVALAPLPALGTNEMAAADTNQAVPVIVASTPPNSTNETVTTANNVTLSKAGNQTASTANFQTQLSRQITLSTNNLSITTADNHVLSAETNLVVTTQTNTTVTPVTNVVVLETNGLLRDYFLFTELTPPPDFTLWTGDSLVLVVDGVRYAFAPTPSPTFVFNRKGFTGTLYRVPPEVLVAIANAKDVEIRVRGVNSAVDRTMNKASRNAFKKYLVKYFVPPPPAAPGLRKPAAEAHIATAAQ